MAKRKEKTPRQPFPPELKRTIRRALLMLLPTAVPVAVGEALNVYLAILTQRLLDASLSGQSGHIARIVAPFFIGLALFIPVDLLSSFMRGCYIRRANTLMKQRYVQRVFAKNISEFQSENRALYLSNITNDMNTVEQRYFASLYTILAASVTFFGGIFILSMTKSWIPVVAAAIGVLLIFFGMRSGRSLEKDEGERSGFLTKYTVFIREFLSAFRIVKSHNLEDRIEKDFNRRSTDVQWKRYKLDKKETVIQTRQSAMFGLFIAALLTLAMLAVRRGGITTGGILLSINGFGMIMGSLSQMAESFPAVASVRPVFLSMEENLENKDLSVEKEEFDGFDNELVFDSVSFAYGDNQVLQDAHFSLHKGGKYLMIGPSGGGKSTILRLVRKYYNPDRGAVLVDGVNLVDIRRESYYRHIANVEQQVFLFEDTLRNNLTLYKDYSDEEIMRAIEGAGLSDYLAGLPNGLEHVIVDNGKNLSGGERARVAIARGLITRADLLLLDEAFASLDERVARSIEKTLLSLDGVTVLSVSHVLFPDTMPLYDAVLEVKRGQVTELAQSSN
ncbi:MAG TPA: ABC transporter ATP-binding protein [Clostridiaceae bacterium]|nr:ABC transporter ATP-binding protein [Clostridiaceae bacterium]